MNRIAQLMALVFIGITFAIERRAPRPIKMNLLEDPVGPSVNARFIGGPLHGEHRVIPNKKYHRVVEMPEHVSAGGHFLVPAKEAVYVRTHRSKASGCWLYIYWGRA